MRKLSEIEAVERIISDYLFTSDFYEIKNWSFDFTGEKKLSEGYNNCFCIVFVNKGNFLIDLSRKTYDMHTGHIVVEKTNNEYKLHPATGECSIFNFTEAFYEQFINDNDLNKSFFFSNPSILSLLLNSSPEIDYLHFQILKKITDVGKLEMDNLMLELVQQIAECITNKTLGPELPYSLRRNHMVTVEKAKEYMNEYFFCRDTVGYF